MSDPALTWVREDRGADTAIVFIHGYGGDSRKTWGRFPSFLCDEPSLVGWDIATMGYSTGLAPGLLEGLWTGSPSLRVLSGLMDTLVRDGDLRHYKALALVAHSMGGLVVQRALLDSAALRESTSHVLLYGTPSGGLSKASWFKFWKRQVKDMDRDGEFVRDLRADWDAAFADPSFVFRAVAGDEDQFVPPSSSLRPFPKEQQRAVVNGHKLSMVKPKAPDSLSVRVLLSALQGKAAPAGPWSSARLAVEMLDFQDAIDRLLPRRQELDQKNLVLLALALDGLDRGAEALEVLEQANKRGTDAQGVLAGRLKRRWLQEGREVDAERALELYQGAYETSVRNRDCAQGYYHGINVAFMTALYSEKHDAARKVAREVLALCDQAVGGPWCHATQGEACFYLADWDRGLKHYAEAVAAHAGPREIESMYEQAARIVAELAPADEREEIGCKLDVVFGW